jgi:hypothetical protein
VSPRARPPRSRGLRLSVRKDGHGVWLHLRTGRDRYVEAGLRREPYGTFAEWRWGRDGRRERRSFPL